MPLTERQRGRPEILGAITISSRVIGARHGDTVELLMGTETHDATTTKSGWSKGTRKKQDGRNGSCGLRSWQPLPRLWQPSPRLRVRSSYCTNCASLTTVFPT